jgi:hypothetical protein
MGPNFLLGLTGWSVWVLRASISGSYVTKIALTSPFQ